MNRERLQQMVTMLRGLPPESEVAFNLETWNCGTSACAVGHACLNPVFKNQGLQWDDILFDPVYEGSYGWLAVERFFDISEGRAEHLFADWRHPTGGETTANEVADRIELFLKEAEVTA
jgi:hypothetical protein